MRALLAILLSAASLLAATEADLRKALESKIGKVVLPAGVILISRPVKIADGAHDLEIAGNGTVLTADPMFRGAALLVMSGGTNIRLHHLSIDGNRDAVGRLVPMPAAGSMLSRVTGNHGILVENVTGIEISEVKAEHVAGFAILINASKNARVHDVEISECGGLNTVRTNNGMGGILFEEGSSDFSVTRSLFGKIRGNAITLRSVPGVAPNRQGRIAQNEFALIARDAVQLAGAVDVTVEDNRGRLIGYPQEETDVTGLVLPSAVHALRDAARVTIRSNAFDNIDGRCMTLTGLSDSTIAGNTCEEGLFGAVLLSGTNNAVTGNRLLRLNLAKRDAPVALATGIYLEAGSKNNRVADNELTGFGMSRHCVVAAETGNQILTNDCSDEAALARLFRPR